MRNQNIRKIFIGITLTFLGICFFWINPAFAQNNLVVEFENDPLFNEANFLPGQGVTRWVKVTNNSGQAQPIATEAINFPGFPDPNNVPTDDLSRALEITISQSGTDLYGGSSPTGLKTLYNFYQDGETYLSDINNGNTAQYDFIISFPSGAENEWQEKTTYFDILVGSQGTEGGNGNNGGTGGTGDGGGGGLIRGLTIFNEVDQEVTETSVTITWTTNYFSTSQVIYDTIPGQFNLSAGPSNYGYANSKEGDDSGLEKVTAHTVTITGLTPSVTYYYRCVSHGSLAVGIEHSFTTLIGTGEQEEEEEEEEIPEPVIPGEEEEEEEDGEIVEGPTEEGVEEETEEIVLGEKEEAPPEEGRGLAAVLSGGLASIIDAFRNILGRISQQTFLCIIIILIVIFIILILLYLLLKKKEKEKEEQGKGGTIQGRNNKFI